MKNLKLIFILIFTIIMNLTVFAVDNLETLTVEQATKKAIEFSRQLKTLDENEEIAQENYEDVKDDYLITDKSHQALNLVVRLTSAKNQIDNINASKELTKESIKLSIINFFMAVITNEKELELYDESIEIAEKDLNIAEVKLNLGLITQNEYNEKVTSLKKQRAEKENKEKTLETAYRSLNNVMGVDADKRYNLVLDEEYTTFKALGNDTSLEAYISSGISSSDKLKRLQQNVDITKYQVDTYSSANNSESLRSKEISYAQAQRNLSEGKETLENGIIDIYNNIKKYESSYETTLETIKYQEKQLEILKIKYDLGNATELEVKRAQYQLESSRLQLNQIIFNHNILKMKLKNINLA